MASRRLSCVAECASEMAGGEATPRHGGDASSSEITSSSAGISCFEGGPAQCLLGVAKECLFFGALQPGQSKERLGSTIIHIIAKIQISRSKRTERYKRTR